MKYKMKPQGVCSSSVEFELKDGKVYNVSFVGGCNGNLKALSKLMDGMDAEEIIKKLKGNTCGFKNTSCADQFARLVEQTMAQENS